MGKNYISLWKIYMVCRKVFFVAIGLVVIFYGLHYFGVFEKLKDHLQYKPPHLMQVEASSSIDMEEI